MLLEMRDITKSFGGVRALKGVHFGLERGEVHALVGENGAGKSTLMKVLSGALQPDSGTIAIDGGAVRFRNVQDAMQQGIVMVYQELALVRDLSVAENLYLGKLSPLVNYRSLFERARDLLQQVGLDIPPEAPVRELGVGAQQLVTIARAYGEEGKVLVLDEPTAALTAGETSKLFALIERLQERGVAIAYISHRLEEIFEVADRVTVLRDGEYVATSEVGQTSKAEIVHQMVGREVGSYQREEHELGEALARFEVHAPNAQPFELDVRRGEILGLAGVIGSGRGDVTAALFGSRGFAEWGGKRIDDPREAIREGAFLVPPDRKTQGLVLALTVGENLTMSVLPQVAPGGFVNRKRERETIGRQLEQLAIRPARPEMRVSQFSGGNQQKVVLGKALATEPRVLLLDEPTRGVDVGARSEIYDILSDLASRGLAIIMSSSDTEELAALCDRVIVFRNHKPVSELEAPITTEEVTAHVTGARELA